MYIARERPNQIVVTKQKQSKPEGRAIKALPITAQLIPHQTKRGER